MARYMVLSHDLELVTVLDLPAHTVEGLEKKGIDSLRVPLLMPVEHIAMDDKPACGTISYVTLEVARLRRNHKGVQHSALTLFVDTANEEGAMQLAAAFAPGQLNTLQKNAYENAIYDAIRRFG